MQYAPTPGARPNFAGAAATPGTNSLASIVQYNFSHLKECGHPHKSAGIFIVPHGLEHPQQLRFVSYYDTGTIGIAFVIVLYRNHHSGIVSEFSSSCLRAITCSSTSRRSSSSNSPSSISVSIPRGPV